MRVQALHAHVLLRVHSFSLHAIAETTVKNDYGHYSYRHYSFKSDSFSI
jgi:hypothetical protein